MSQIKFNATVKNSIGNKGMIQDAALKSIAGKKVTVTIEVDEGTETTTTPKAV